MNFKLLKRDEKNIFYLLIIAMILWFVLNFFFGERIQIDNGLGWDGQLYFDIAKRFSVFIHEKLLSFYYVQRIFPSFVVHATARILHLSLNAPSSIIHIFFLYDLVVILIGMYIFYRIAKLQAWKYPVFLIGFSALFLNYPILKLIPYYPILTDYTALTLALLMFYLYLVNNFLGLVIVTLIGAFTFPTLIYCGAILLLFENKPKEKTYFKKFINISIKRLPNRFFLALSFTVFIAVIALHFMGTIHPSQFTKNFLALLDFPKKLHPLSPFVGIASFLGVMTFLFFMILPFIKEQFLLRINLVRLSATICLLFLIKLIQMHLSNGEPGPLTASLFVKVVLLESVAYPFIFLVSHFIYYGPFILLSILYWKEIVSVVQKNSAGLALLLLIYGMLIIGSESRQYINAVPLFVFLLCEVLNKKNITLRFANYMIILSLVISKFWLPINIVSWQGGDNDLLQFPYQMLLMNFGPEMGNKMYWVQFLVMIIVFYGLWNWKKKVELKKENPLHSNISFSEL